jgi:dTDP-4-amino-4,6-dideoxygalactose transaminase
MDRIDVTKAFLPPLEEFQEYLAKIWASGQLTNQGPLLREFEGALKDHLGLADAYLHFVANGTLALQLAIRSLDITGGEVITTPFTYVATASAILWERCTPVFVDVDAGSLCMDPGLVENAITERTSAILPVHVFGNAVDVTAIGSIADRAGLPVIYDGAHAFGARLHGESLLGFGDVSVASFHATKTFHTIEGGAVITRDPEVSGRLELIKRFGHNGDEHFRSGINAKATEFSAAMGLVNLRHIDQLTTDRRSVVEAYDTILAGRLERPRQAVGLSPNFSYYPVLFADEAQLLSAQRRLNDDNIFPRRYFYPSLTHLPYLSASASCPVAESVATRILCLPLHPGLTRPEVERIAALVC